MTSEANYKRRLFRGYLAAATAPAAVFLILGSASFLLSLRYVYRELDLINRASLEQARNAVETVLKESDAIILGMSTDPVFYAQTDQVLAGPMRTLEDMKLRASVLGSLKSAVNVRPYLRSIYVYMPNYEDVIATSTDDVVRKADFPDTSWIEGCLERKDELSYHIEARTVQLYPGLDIRFRYLTIFRNILSSAGFTFKGILVMNIDMEYLERLMSAQRQSEPGVVALLDAQGRILASAGGDALRREDAKDHIIYESAFATYPFVLKAMIPKLDYFRLPLTLALITLLSTLSAIVLGLGAAYGLSRRSFRNIAAIVDIIQAAERGDPLPQPRISDKDGYHDLIYSVLKSFVEGRYLKLQLFERDLRNKTIELLALQSQLNPHFLFNTLTSISCRAFAFTGGPNNVTNMIDHLANLLGYSLGSPGQSVTMDEEIAYAEHYVAIQLCRYKDEFTVEWKIDPEARPLRTTKLLLQPLIENAIYHGVREAHGNRRIVVEAGTEDEYILVSVFDNGVGMSPERLAEVRARIESEDHPDAHIGLYNTARRLKLRYGDDASIAIQSELGAGTRVNLRFPSRGTPSP